MKTPDPARFYATLGAVYAWASPEAVANLSEPQIYGYSHNIDYVEKMRGASVAMAMWGGGKER